MSIAHFGGEDDRPQDIKDIERHLGTETEMIEAAIKSPVEIRSVLGLWLAGAGYAEIAELKGYRSAAQARAVVERALADTVDDTEDRSRMRQKMSLTLDRYLRSIVGKALDSANPEQPTYMRLALGITDRKIRLHGLDAPSQLVVTTPQSRELEEWVIAVASASGIDMPVEGDPFADVVDAEVVEDGVG